MLLLLVYIYFLFSTIFQKEGQSYICIIDIFYSNFSTLKKTWQRNIPIKCTTHIKIFFQRLEIFFSVKWTLLNGILVVHTTFLSKYENIVPFLFFQTGTRSSSKETRKRIRRKSLQLSNQKWILGSIFDDFLKICNITFGQENYDNSWALFSMGLQIPETQILGIRSDTSCNMQCSGKGRKIAIKMSGGTYTITSKV